MLLRSVDANSMVLSLQWNERTALACTSVPDGLVGDGELGKVVTDHVWLNLHVDELLTIVREGGNHYSANGYLGAGTVQYSFTSVIDLPGAKVAHGMLTMTIISLRMY